uniref:ATP synthase F0 subunit 8 n=1 Tax=Megalyra sp. MM-2014 TaxID=1503221 RepID=A0A096XL90_9HYME|nr:ATP synthase F0 subunit 8 [Megalyra sp. MM-2014]
MPQMSSLMYFNLYMFHIFMFYMFMVKIHYNFMFNLMLGEKFKSDKSFLKLNLWKNIY